MGKWYDDYKNLNLMSGKISFILEDDEDMIEIHYKDGMLIDVGYIERMHSYLITVVSNDTDECWKNPLEEIKIENKAELFDKIQETIRKYRKKNYPTFVVEQFDNMWKWTFFHDFKESRKKHGVIGAICILFLLCVIQGLSNKFIWQGSFWEGFLYPFALLFVIFIISQNIINSRHSNNFNLTYICIKSFRIKLCSCTTCSCYRIISCVHFHSMCYCS